MSKQIYKAICAAAIAVSVISLLLVLWGIYSYFSAVTIAQLRSEADLIAQGVNRLGLSYLHGLHFGDLRVTLVSPDGSVLFDSASDFHAMTNHLMRDEVRDALSSGYGEATRHSQTLMTRFIYLARRLDDGSILRVSVEQSSVLDLLIGMWPVFVVIALVALGLSFVFASRLSKRIVSPLNNLNLDSPLDNEHYEELMPLFRRMHSQQRNLLQLAQYRREFTANVSHELRTPLHSIAGYSELMKNGIAREEDVPRFAETIHRLAKRLIGLVDDIISLSRLDEGAKNFEWETFDLYADTANIVQSLSETAAGKGVFLSVSGEPTHIYGIRHIVGSIIRNLCENAIKYNREGGKVTVHVSNKTLTVKDTGIGIPEEFQERVFERFFRVDKSRSGKVDGSGLGLSIVKHAAEIHEAKIRLESEPGAGTNVTVTFR